MDYEAGTLNKDEIIAGFQELIKSGLAWELQGSYGRMATSLIEQGLCEPAPVRKSTKVGPFEGVGRDEKRMVGDDEYRIIQYSAYNAMGLIGTERNGIAVLSETRRQVICDEIAIGASQAEKTRKFDELMKMDEREFALEINASPRLREEIPVPEAKKKRMGPR
jgi:hypothetical protein